MLKYLKCLSEARTRTIEMDVNRLSPRVARRGHAAPAPVLRVVSHLLAALVVASCGSGSSGGTEPGTSKRQPPVSFRSGRGIVDTIQATPSVPIVVAVVDTNGAPRPNVVVTFTITAAEGQHVPIGGSAGSVTRIAVRTDSGGLVTVGLRLGTVVGKWTLKASDLLAGNSDTLTWTVLAGKAARVRVAPGDSAVTLSRSLTVVPTITDRWENAAVGTVTFTVDSGQGSAAIDQSGRVTGTTFGRARMRVQLVNATAADTARVSIVPRGVIGVAVSAGLSTDGIAMLNVDGSGYRLLAPGTADYSFPSWSPDGSAIAYNVGLPTGILYRVDTNGVRTKLSPLGAMPSETWARYSYDGQYIYFTGGYYPDSLDTYRMRADGSGTRTRVTPPRPGSDRYWKASPSPDGLQLAYSEAGASLRVYDLATSTDHTLVTNSHAESPRFSPDGQWIAFADDYSHSISIIRPDGTGLRQVTTGGFANDWGHDWSPDGVWIIYQGDQALRIVRVSDGLTLPLPYSRGFYFPTWRLK